MELLIVAVAGLLAIAGATQLSDRVKVAPALLLLGLGIVVGFLPVVPAIEVEPEIILEGVLPPLLYATAVSISTINFRRELAPVVVLAVLLVAVSAAVIGAVLTLVVPSLSLAWAVAMGAVLSPTDAVAISIARRLGVSQRIITVLEGEGLLNDATALVVLSSAVAAATAGTVTVAGVVGDFATAVLVALVVGWAVGELTLHLRARITDASVDTVISFTIPFLAALPAEHLGGSGLVAAVVAGLVTGHRSPRLLPPDHRIAGQETWHTVELVLEGFIFLVMGLQLFGIVEEVSAAGPSMTTAVWLAVLAGGLTVAVRAAVVAPMLAWLRRRAERHATRWEEMSEPVQAFERRCEAIAHGEVPEDMQIPWDPHRRGVRRRLKRALRLHHLPVSSERTQRRASAAVNRIRRRGADVEYYRDEPLGLREGAVIVWAGMRGAVTLAAAQTLPASAPNRSFLLLVAVLVAAGSLVIQGLTLPWMVKVVRPSMEGPADEEERGELVRLLVTAAREVVAERGEGPTVLPSRQLVPAPGEVVGHDAADRDARIVHKANGEYVVSTALAAERWKDPQARHHDLVSARATALDVVRAQREALLDAGELGLYSAGSVEYVLKYLDYEEIMLTSQPG
ncbi:cation:proton antiporter [Actinomyces sp. HMT897]|uniref:cation:proton antiporter n=1 Tax=Actinomyces sp. HMT897 TaxID=2789424 RepID=UPI00190DD40E|nr:cation:proton antiporter [Actinomyces sp. HMT897]QQO77754.1 cation:proton antiporter [Actinomyces sp. HMT897]